ncbi:MAG: RHS repeat-associated core domain-containing protein, partial [Elusimicrobiales bacterium]
NRPVTITAPGGTQFQFTYDAAGRRTRMDMGVAVAAEYVYDAANQLTGITYRRKTDNAVIASVGYTYDNAGNRATMADDFGSHGFAYDDLHRLTSAVHPSSGALTTQNETFAYDAVGNRQSDAVRAGYAYDAANRLNSDSLYTYNYDNNGNLTTKTRISDNAQTAYIYDAQNRLTQVNLPSGYSETLRYDATGRRIAKTITHNSETIREQHYIYDGEDIAFVTDAAGALKSLYTHGPGTDEPLMLRKGASDYFLLADGLGSIIAIADQTGTVVERTQYQAYGRPVFKNEVTGSTSSWSQTGSLYSYTAREWDAETGLFYYRARYYAPDTGRFIQKDPIGFNGGDTNLYAYVYDNPMNLTDSLGLSAADVERIKSIFNRTVNRMNREKKRTRISPLNNLISIFQRLAHGRFGKPYLFCYEQTDELLGALRKEQKRQSFDDKWDFNNVSTEFHEYAVALSHNPVDPFLKLDPYWNLLREVNR